MLFNLLIWVQAILYYHFCAISCAQTVPADADTSLSDPVAESPALTSVETSFSTVPIEAQKSEGLFFYMIVSDTCWFWVLAALYNWCFGCAIFHIEITPTTADHSLSDPVADSPAETSFAGVPIQEQEYEGWFNMVCDTVWDKWNKI